MSLIEVVVATSLMGAVVAVLGPAMISSFNAGRIVDNESRALDEVRVAIARIDRELRSASCIASPTAGSGGSTLAFTTMAGAAGAYDVTYSVSGGQLQRTTASGSQNIGNGLVVTSHEFSHAANPGQRASVDIALQVRFDASRDPRTVETTVTGRNAWEACP
ncbi:MAG TPA: hypothetical protein VI916_10130 [Acidimicrobiia bacterium]|nr:hypothetical protein [Acidimicrobiia bacterium]